MDLPGLPPNAIHEVAGAQAEGRSLPATDVRCLREGATMSLTRYEWNGHGMTTLTDGAWVKAEEAEARIKELEARNQKLERYIGEAQERHILDKARLRAADELADACDREITDGHWTCSVPFDGGNGIIAARTAYREAGE
jgi:hypothetical protein